MKYLILILLSAIAFDYFGRPRPIYKVDDCAKDQIHGDYRKVTNVGRYIYNYCILRDNKCKKKYSMRIKDFNRIMKKVDCKEAK